MAKKAIKPKKQSNRNQILSKEANLSISDNIKKNLGVIEGQEVNVSVNLSKKREKVEDFVMLFQGAVQEMLKGSMMKSTLAVFVYFLGKLDYGNHIGIDQKTIAEENNLSLGTIKIVIPELMRLNMIIKYNDIQDNRRNVYIVNPLMAWKGTIKRRREVKKILDKNQLSLLDQPGV
jgi:DNA-binding MarR family transcriptional regulator